MQYSYYLFKKNHIATYEYDLVILVYLRVRVEMPFCLAYARHDALLFVKHTHLEHVRNRSFISAF